MKSNWNLDFLAEDIKIALKKHNIPPTKENIIIALVGATICMDYTTQWIDKYVEEHHDNEFVSKYLKAKLIKQHRRDE